jgi:hypothetical protein
MVKNNQTNDKVQNTEKTIHFIDGNRGNIGKSFFSSLMCHFYVSNQQGFTLFDTDRHKKDVSVMYGGITDVHFDGCNEIMANYTNEATKVDRIYEEALKQDVIVNMPSDSHKELFFWLQQNGLDNPQFLQEEKIKIIIWYLSNGDRTSLELLKQSIPKASAFTTILVRNFGIDHEWNLEKTDLVEFLNSIPKLDLSVMPRGEREATFKLGKAYNTYSGNKLSLNRLTKYLQTQCSEIVSLFPLTTISQAA